MVGPYGRCACTNDPSPLKVFMGKVCKKIVILGAGQVGTSVAETLVKEGNDITLVDINPDRLHELQDRMDIRTVVGSGSYPDILRQAGAGEADIVLAVTVAASISAAERGSSSNERPFR